MVNRHRPAMWPAVFVGVTLALFWGAARWAYAARGAWAGAQSNVLLGVLALMFLLLTVTAVIWAAKCTTWTRTILGYALVVDVCGVFFLAVGLFSGLVHFWDAVRIYLLLGGWGLLWTVLAKVLCKWNVGASVAICLVLAMVMFASPISFVPLVQVSSGTTRDRMLAVTRHSAPMLAGLDALKGSMGPRAAAGWGEWPQMYRLSPIAQEMAILGLPQWWASALVYAGAAGVIAGLNGVISRRRRPMVPA